MLYVFIILLIGAFFNQRTKLFQAKRNLVLFLILSAAGITLGVIHMLHPYLPSIALMMEKYTK